MDKENVAHLYNRLLRSNKNEWTTDTCNNTDELKKHAKGKKSDRKDYTRYDSIYMKFLEKAEL